MGNTNSSLNDKNGVPLADYSGEVDVPWLIENAKTGDLLLFSGSSVFSKSIKEFTQTAYTHVAVVIRRGLRVYVLQSVFQTDEYYWDDLMKRKANSGVMLNHLEDVVKEDDGKVYYRPLHMAGERVFNPVAIKNFLSKVKGKLYEWNPFVLLSVPTRGNTWNDSTSYFCSEIVYEFLWVTGIVDKDKSTKKFQNIMPSDFVYMKFAPFKLKQWASYGTMKKVV